MKLLDFAQPVLPFGGVKSLRKLAQVFFISKLASLVTLLSINHDDMDINCLLVS